MWEKVNLWRRDEMLPRESGWVSAIPSHSC